LPGGIDAHARAAGAIMRHLRLPPAYIGVMRGAAFGKV
jgi:hypothetical protein